MPEISSPDKQLLASKEGLLSGRLISRLAKSVCFAEYDVHAFSCCSA
jgi:hypothetical protein